MEQDQIRHSPDAGPVVVGFRHVAGPGVQKHPNGLLGEEVWVAGEGPETSGEEPAVELMGGEVGAGGDFGGALVGLFGVLKVYILMRALR